MREKRLQYEEARKRIFGETAAAEAAAASTTAPNTPSATPPQQSPAATPLNAHQSLHDSPQARGGRGGRGGNRGRGGRGGGLFDKGPRTGTPAPFGANAGHSNNNNGTHNNNAAAAGSASTSPGPPRELYDPHTPPQRVHLARRPHGGNGVAGPAAAAARGFGGGDGEGRPRQNTPELTQQRAQQPIREPRIPGKGIGFERRRGVAAE
jgi:hypothetical protein